MKRGIIVSLLVLLSVKIYAEEPLNVLFIGSSLTFANDMPGMFRDLAEQAGKEVNVEEVTFGGQALRHIINSSFAIDKIKSKAWDVVILQDDAIAAFPDMYSLGVKTLTSFKSVIRESNPNANIIYQMAWGLKHGVNIQGEGYYSYEELFQKLYDGTLYFANQMNFIVGPVGKAWNTSISQNSGIELFSSDNSHPALPGSYLAACVFYSTIFGESVENNSYYSSLMEKDAVFLQKIASETVLSNTELWNMSIVTGSTEQIKKNDFDIQAYPNPFSQEINFNFKLDKPSSVLLTIFDNNGRRMKSVIDQKMDAGDHIVGCNFLNEMSPGIYFFNLKTPDCNRTGKIIRH